MTTPLAPRTREAQRRTPATKSDADLLREVRSRLNPKAARAADLVAARAASATSLATSGGGIEPVMRSAAPGLLSAEPSRITVGYAPSAIAVAPDGLAYVISVENFTVSVVDTATDTALGEIPLGGYPNGGIATGPDGRAYVALTPDSALAVVDRTGVVGRIDVPLPFGLAVSPDGRLYVTSLEGTLVMIDTTGGSPTQTVYLGGGFGMDVAVAPNGRIYVPDVENAAVVVIDPDGSVRGTIDLGGDPYEPYFIAAAPNGRLYVTQQLAGTVTVIDSADDSVRGTIPVGGAPFGIGTGPSGRVFVTDLYADRLTAIDSLTDTVVDGPLTTGSGPYDVAVVPGGKVYVTDYHSDTITVLRPPTLTGLSPAQGGAEGGTQVVLTGTRLSTVYEVRFGDAPATAVFYNAAGTELLATTPPGAVGPVTVTAVSPLATVSLPDGFTYLSNEPTLTAVSPGQGSETGGTQVTLSGTHLSGASVTFGGVPATDLFYNAAGTRILATTPPGTPGAADVTVTTTTGSATLHGAFTYMALPPSLTQISPAAGPVAGGTRVTLTGTHLVGATGVTFNGVAGTNPTVSPAGTSITVTTPPGTAGPAAVVVTTLSGTSNPLTYTYVPLPAPVQITPAQGPSTGGTVVTITGTHLADTTGVTFNGVAGTNLSVNPAGTSITVTTPPGTAGVATVAVTTAGGTAVVPGGFLFSDPTSLSAAPAVIRQSGLLQFVIPSLSATLTDDATHAPLAGRTVTFAANTAAGRLSLGSAVTNTAGVAARTNVSVPATAVTATSWTATFAGTPGNEPATGTATLTFQPL